MQNQEIENNQEIASSNISSTEQAEDTVTDDYKKQYLGDTNQKQSLPNDITFNIKKAEIVDLISIEKYNKEFDNNFFIPDIEEGTFDDEELLAGNYVASADKVGGQIFPIAVAVCPSDPTMKEGQPEYNPESQFRIHGRIADGRHRFLEAKSLGKKWNVKYYLVNDFEEYMQLRSHMDSKKKTNTTEMDTKFRQLAEYLHKVKGVAKEDVCNQIVSQYSPPHSKSTIRNHVPDEYKNQEKSKARTGKTKSVLETVHGKKIKSIVDKQTKRKLSAKDKKIEELNHERDGLLKEMSSIKESAEVMEEVVKKHNDLLPFLKNKNETVIEGTDIKVVVEINLETKSVKVTKV